MASCYWPPTKAQTAQLDQAKPSLDSANAESLTDVTRQRAETRCQRYSRQHHFPSNIPKNTLETGRGACERITQARVVHQLVPWRIPWVPAAARRLTYPGTGPSLSGLLSDGEDEEGRKLLLF